MTSSTDLTSLGQKIAEMASESMTRDRVPGLSIGIVRGDSLAGYYSFGTQKLGEDKPPIEQTISRVASITKTFTGTAILQLRDLGQMELDDPLLLHLPDFTVASALRGTLEGVTLRRLMTHYSGLRTEHPLTDWDAPSFPTGTDLLNGLAEIEVVIPQDSQWKYSNLGVGLLGHVIEQVSGIPYEQYVYEEITGPLGLSNTRYELDADQALLKATGYSHMVVAPSGGRTIYLSGKTGHDANRKLIVRHCVQEKRECGRGVCKVETMVRKKLKTVIQVEPKGKPWQ